MATTYYLAPTTSPPAGWSAGNDTNNGLSKSTPKATLVGAFAAMSGGDTLVIADGTYTGADNCVGQVGGTHGNVTDGSHNPPSGTAEAYTIIQAEHEGQVTFVPSSSYMTFYVDDRGAATAACAYVEWHGLKWVDPYNIDAPGGASITLSSKDWHHHKFFRCGVHRKMRYYPGSGIGVDRGEYFLFEECYVWGTCRYPFIVSDLGRNGDAYGGKHVVFRRCLVRHEDTTAYSGGGNEAVAAFQVYTTEHVEIQNCIVIDTDTSVWDHIYGGGAFSIRQRTSAPYGYERDINYRGNIVLNQKGWNAGSTGQFYWGMIVGNQFTPAITYTNTVIWDVMAGVDQVANGGAAGSPWFNGLTLGAADDPNWIGTRSPTIDERYATPGSKGFVGLGDFWNPDSWIFTVTNYVIVAHQTFPIGYCKHDYGAIYSNSGGIPISLGFYTCGPGENDYCENVTTGVYPSGRKNHPTNNEYNPFTGNPVSPSTLGNGIPALKYICRIEAGSNLSGTGEAGADRGATVVKRYGVSGTLWGDTGYNTLTDEDLWPFPYESQIRSDLRTYTISGNPYFPDDPTFGKRGFCADGETLTHYIWNYLGNGNPYAQVAVPDSDVGAGSWTASTGSDLYAMVAEFPPDDTTYIRSSATPTDDTAVLGVTMQPPDDGPVILHIRGRWI